jgi:hypothetical protein
MSFKRQLAPRAPLVDEALTGALVGLGFALAASLAEDEPNLEDTLLAASLEGLERSDLRVLALLTTWLEVHAERVLADRLVALVTEQPSARVRAFWSMLPALHPSDRRFARPSALGPPERIDLVPVGTAFQLRRHGEDPRFARSALRVPAHALRSRPEDVLDPPRLARQHRAYRWRVLLGPTYRADMWAALEVTPSLSAAELARRTYGSFATAWHVRRDATVLGPRPFRGALAGR